MKLKNLFLSASVVLGLSLFSFSQETFASTEIESDVNVKEIASQIQYYDGEGNKIYPYTIEELEKMVDPNRISTFATHSSGPTNFTDEIWVGGGLYGKTWLNPKSLLITPRGVAKAIKVTAWESAAPPKKSYGSVDLPAGWQNQINLSFSHLDRGKSYRFLIENQSSTNMIYFDDISLVYN